jgi:hypothetical protein
MADVQTPEVDAKVARASETVWNDTSSKDEQDHFYGEKNTNVEGGWNLKFVFCFIETTREPLYLQLGKRNFLQ